MNKAVQYAGIMNQLQLSKKFKNREYYCREGNEQKEKSMRLELIKGINSVP